MPENRPAIPNDLQRRVRQRCRFACVICRSPIVEYDHIVEYSEVREHEYENLVLLCPTCHNKKKKGQLSVDRIVRSRDSCEKRVRTAPETIDAEYKYIDLGSNLIESFNGTLFSIDGFGWATIRFEELMLISARIVEPNGEAAIEIVDNVYTLCTEGWDVEFKGDVLTFRNAHRGIFSSMTFDAKEKTLHLTGKFRPGPGLLVDIRDNGIYVNRRLLARKNYIGMTRAGVVIVENPGVQGGAISGGGAHFCSIQGGEAALFNCTECECNVVQESYMGLVWETKFLVDLAKQPMTRAGKRRN